MTVYTVSLEDQGLPHDEAERRRNAWMRDAYERAKRAYAAAPRDTPFSDVLRWEQEAKATGRKFRGRHR